MNEYMKVYEHKRGRHIMIVGTVRDVKMTILNIYAPNKGDPGFFKEVSALLANHTAGFVIMEGTSIVY